MLYILDQRLRAQNIPGDKARKGERRPARTASPMPRSPAPSPPLSPNSQTCAARPLHRLTTSLAPCFLIARDCCHNATAT